MHTKTKGSSLVLVHFFIANVAKQDLTLITASPNGDESWEAGTIHPVTWSSTGMVGNVRIEYSINNGTSWTTVTDSTANTGSFTWPLPHQNSENCLIRVSETDGDPMDVSDNVFSITPVQAVFTVISPNGGEVFLPGSTEEITWNSSGDIPDVRIDYSYDNGSSWTTVVASTGNDGSYDWLVPGTPSENCLVMVREAGSDYGHYDISDAVFSINTASPTLRIISPNGGENLATNRIHEITWFSAGEVGNVRIECTTNNGTSWSDIITETENDGSFEWLVPGVFSTECLVRISDIDGDPQDTGDATFSIIEENTGALTLTSPNGGESLQSGSQHEITWNSTGNINTIIIKYSPDNGSSWITIIPSTENDGSFNWTIPDTPSDECLVRISESDDDYSPYDVSDAVFSIIPADVPTIILTSPNGGENLTAGSTYNITWAHGGSVGDVKLEYSTDSGASWTYIIDPTENDGSYAWIVPGEPSENCLLRIAEAYVDSGPTDVSDAEFSISTSTSQSITVISPNGGETLSAGMTHTITWTGVGIIADVKIEFSTDSGTSWTNIAETTANTGFYNWEVPDNTSENCLLRISDTDGALSDVSDAVFSIAPYIEPSITITFPNGGESLTCGSTQQVNWTSTGRIEYVKIDYSIDSGANWNEIIDNTTNTGSYTWTVPDTPSENCKLRISDSSGGSGAFDESDAVFSIIESGQSITVSKPAGGETFVIGTAMEIEWHTSGISDEVEILLRKADDSDGYTLETGWPFDGSPYAYTLPEDTEPGQYFIKIRQGTISGTSPDFIISSSAQPAITVTAPTTGERYYKGITHLITWMRTEDIAANDVRIDLFDATGTEVIRTLETGTENDGFYKWTVDEDLQTGNFTIQVQEVGENVAALSSEFSINETTPLVFTSPRSQVEWYRGVTHLITWRRDETIAGTDITLELYDETGANLIKTISTAAENSGSFEWLVDDDIPDGNYTLRIETIDEIDSHDSEVFSIAEPGSLLVTVPYGCEEWQVGEIHTICWYRDELTSRLNVYIGLYNAAGTQKVKDIISAENTGTYDWLIDGDIIPGDYVIKIVTVDETQEAFSNVVTITWPDNPSASLPNEKNIEIGYNDDMESRPHYEGFKHPGKYYGPILSSDSYEPSQQEFITPDDSPRLLHIPVDRIRRGHPGKKKKKSTGSNKLRAKPVTTNTHRTRSAFTTYYVWSYDGRIMAEYDATGICTKEYIYLGNRLIAEYLPPTDQYYYHFQDQINSTRIVTDDDGNVVHSAAHGPYGDIQQEWVNTYSPKQKFSGKERESYSDLDYFGARYYDSHSYRFISVDPVKNRAKAIVNPQLWNLYAYCMNNPITLMDPDGREIGSAIVDILEDHYLEKYSTASHAEYNRQIRTKVRVYAAEVVIAYLLLKGLVSPESPEDYSRKTKGLERQLEKHKKKLKDYKKDPYSVDNKDFLKDPRNKDRKKEIMKTRKEKLKHQIKNFKKQIKEEKKKNGS